ncbi:transposase family protein [Streptomyces sp. NPDC090045]|uniref:transposase family protein n=1 Tax=Streptomyces sp. NPDC090045 TaxID=3365927 RepID=UPI0037F1E652
MEFSTPRDPTGRPCLPTHPRDSRGVRHALAVVLALAACVVLTGATSLLAVGGWISDAPTDVLEQLGRDLAQSGHRHPETRRRHRHRRRNRVLTEPGETSTRYFPPR